ncbi:MAG: hypothetical protein C4289_05110 [Chloroflexota bacterium]
MTEEELESLYQFLAGYWYDREEDDRAIVQEFLQDATPQEVRRYIQLLRHFLEWPESPQRKAEIVRKAVWRWFPDDVNAPLAWLHNVLSLIESASTPVIS